MRELDIAINTSCLYVSAARIVVAPVRSLPKRGELGEEAKNSLFINAPPRYEPAVTLESIRSGTIAVDSVLADQPPAFPCKVISSVTRTLANDTCVVFVYSLYSLFLGILSLALQDALLVCPLAARFDTDALLQVLGCGQVFGVHAALLSHERSTHLERTLKVAHAPGHKVWVRRVGKGDTRCDWMLLTLPNAV